MATLVPPLSAGNVIIQRVLDDDRLTDECWNSEMREVELWENERLGGSYILVWDRLSGPC